MSIDYALVRFRCCRDWPCAMPARVGRCGYCGEVPEYVAPWEDGEGES